MAGLHHLVGARRVDVQRSRDLAEIRAGWECHQIPAGRVGDRRTRRLAAACPRRTRQATKHRRKDQQCQCSRPREASSSRKQAPRRGERALFTVHRSNCTTIVCREDEYLGRPGRRCVERKRSTRRLVALDKRREPFRTRGDDLVAEARVKAGEAAVGHVTTNGRVTVLRLRTKRRPHRGLQRLRPYTLLSDVGAPPDHLRCLFGGLIGSEEDFLTLAAEDLLEDQLTDFRKTAVGSVPSWRQVAANGFALGRIEQPCMAPRPDLGQQAFVLEQKTRRGRSAARRARMSLPPRARQTPPFRTATLTAGSVTAPRSGIHRAQARGAAGAGSGRRPALPRRRGRGAPAGQAHRYTPFAPDPRAHRRR